jgi:hypothetical protein
MHNKGRVLFCVFLIAVAAYAVWRRSVGFKAEIVSSNGKHPHGSRGDSARGGNLRQGGHREEQATLNL